MSSPKRAPTTWRDILELSKPRITGLVVISTWMGYLLAGKGHGEGFVAILLVATFLVSAGANTLNQFLEIDTDKLMPRTKNRPLPSGRVSPGLALVLGTISGTAGVTLLYVYINPVAGLLGLSVLITYVLMYTPLKRFTSVNTPVGAVPGSIPALLGWVGATGQFGLEPGVLFLMMFVWQHPHTLAIAWMYRNDYKKAGLKMITVDDTNASRTRRQLVLYTVLLIVASLVPTLVGITGQVYFYGALLSGLAFAWVVWGMIRTPDHLWAKRVMKASVFHLPLLFLLMFLDRVWPAGS
ncbi:MAG: heme o synthase [Deltaproteobacteria bacterium]|nr:heme o synthase [Deltaproteobacteria bacterium]